MSQHDSSLSIDSLGSLKAHFLDEKGMFKKHKVNQILISNNSKYDLIIITEMDPLIKKLIDGTKVTKEHQIPSIETVLAGETTKLDVRTKINYLTVLRRDTIMSGYFLIRSKRLIKRSAKWTATTKMVDGCQLHCTDGVINQYVNTHLLSLERPSISGRDRRSISGGSVPSSAGRGSISNPVNTPPGHKDGNETDKGSVEDGSDSSDDDQPSYNRKLSHKIHNEIMSSGGGSNAGDKNSWCCGCFGGKKK